MANELAIAALKKSRRRNTFHGGRSNKRLKYKGDQENGNVDLMSKYKVDTKSADFSTVGPLHSSGNAKRLYSPIKTTYTAFS